MYQIPPQATCAFHYDRQAANACARCGTFLCVECRRFTAESQVFCPACLGMVSPERAKSTMMTIGILTMVHGGLLNFMGLFFIAIALFFPAMMLMVPEPQGQDAPPAAFFGIIGLVYAGFALIHIVPGILQLIAGNRMRKLKSRNFAIGALASGLVSIFGMYCAVTAIPLFVVGLVFLLRKDVVEAFEREASQNP